MVAADSRGYSAVTHAQWDDRCKISAFGNQLIFAAAGKTAYLSADPALAWNVHTIARDAFESRRESKTTLAFPDLLSIAVAWGDEVKIRLKN